ncbi:class I SAM-dependent methyltransferase [Cupriavidus gilardii]|uniref:class I SAM-dependent methyltransferase n=1 Tax=Cupriavidus gilardii TaxID=82541 RepID=UPI0021C1A68A|nr:class I SAM-dependent methyltransferase [Cupriavidus gilardii]MCT9017149.1 class I SAM-dependent methyltransferase [Cupriavidus gilardii]MCT9056818.1 class I SAM-dependent methyltransferase [Cupriavidus gilardii]WNG67736.1 methyltransferase domain-containing protein [Cupriavidus gilardii]
MAAFLNQEKTSPISGCLNALRRAFAKARNTAENAWDHLAEDVDIRRFTAGNAPSLATMHAYYNRRVTGDPNVHFLQYFKDRYIAGRPNIRMASFGSGSGHLERSLISNFGYECVAIDGYELNPKLVDVSNSKAKEIGAHHLRYEVADLNAIQVPASAYDVAVFFHSLHHVENLEHCLDQVRTCLKPGGVLLLVDYIGKNRLQFTDEQLRYATTLLHLIPAKYRLSKDGKTTKSAASRQPVHEVIAEDPSEAVRSEDIIPTVEQRFERIEFHSLGGSVLNHVFKGIAGNFDESNQADLDMIRLLQGMEEWLERNGHVPPDFVFAVYRPIG